MCSGVTDDLRVLSDVKEPQQTKRGYGRNRAQYPSNDVSSVTIIGSCRDYSGLPLPRLSPMLSHGVPLAFALVRCRYVSQFQCPTNLIRHHRVTAVVLNSVNT